MAKNRAPIFTVWLILSGLVAFAQTGKISGKVTDSKGQSIEAATVAIPQLNKGMITDNSGEYQLKDIPYGTWQLEVTFMGFMPYRSIITLNNDEVNHNVTLTSESGELLNEIVVTGTRTPRRKLASPVAVNILSNKTFDVTQSNVLSEGLCFQPGLRMETDCQTCNYSQLRMNGMGGAYSQILINSRPVFSSLMSLYGLEQIPTNMIERVEVVRGGGSVLYGSSAIAGTVNILTKEPKQNSFTISDNLALIGGKSTDHFLNANVQMVNKEQTAGVSVFTSRRDRQSYDANGDGFSEMPWIRNSSFGINSFMKLSARDKLDVNGWSIYEERQGGNNLEGRPDKADQSEYRLHNILLGGFNYEHQFKKTGNSLVVYGSGQNTKRTHYTGMDQSDGWGHTKNHAMQGGVQLNLLSPNFLKGSNLFTVGMENQYEYTFDQIPAYEYLIDQHVNLFGVFAQSDWEITKRWTVLLGVRLNKSNKVEHLALTPRLSSLFKISDDLQLRGSYARGFKAPQALETDMHIAFSGGGVSLIRIDPNLKEETSNSFNVSLDFNKAYERYIYGFTVDGFYTKLQDAFALEELGQDANGNQQLLRKNNGDALVHGIILEGRLNYSQKFQLETGFTFQRSTYFKQVSWSKDIEGSKDFLRTPNAYGFYTLTILPQSRFNINFSGVITGPMKVPHFAGAPGVDKDVVKITPTYCETNVKVSYRFTLKRIKQDLQLSVGVKNLLNQYQRDFDIGKNRDSNYIYGPARPRTFFVGLKFGLM